MSAVGTCRRPPAMFVGSAGSTGNAPRPVFGSRTCCAIPAPHRAGNCGRWNSARRSLMRSGTCRLVSRGDRPADPRGAQRDRDGRDHGAQHERRQRGSDQGNQTTRHADRRWGFGCRTGRGDGRVNTRSAATERAAAGRTSLVEQILLEIEAGGVPDAEQLAGRFPETPDEIRHLIAVVQLIRGRAVATWTRRRPTRSVTSGSCANGAAVGWASSTKPSN